MVRQQKLIHNKWWKRYLKGAKGVHLIYHPMAFFMARENTELWY